MDPSPKAIINTMRYPIDCAGPMLDVAIDSARHEIAAVGCAVLKGFVRRDVIPELIAECERVAPQARRNFNCTNVYFTADRAGLPAEHPLRRFYDRSNAFVPADSARRARRVAFARNSGALVFLRGGIDRKNFWQLNPQTGTERQLTDLPASFVIGDFDVSPDGAEIVFDRVQENSSVVLIERAKESDTH
jgi:hypothetical protein